jgi:hypothetical protein
MAKLSPRTTFTLSSPSRHSMDRSTSYTEEDRSGRPGERGGEEDRSSSTEARYVTRARVAETRGVVKTRSRIRHACTSSPEEVREAGRQGRGAPCSVHALFLKKLPISIDPPPPVPYFGLSACANGSGCV